MQVWVGTSGYSYPDWVGSFYPERTAPRRMLSYYCRRFPLVELNFTFYRLPTPSMLARLADQTPAGFQFLVKMPRSLSHDETSGDLEAFRDAVNELKQRGQLLGLLCQLPQAAHDEARHRNWIEKLASEFAGYGLAVEFRHRSWNHPETLPWLAEKKLVPVSVDVPDLPGLFPTGLLEAGPLLYVRFHSRNAAKWYLKDKDKQRYDYHYSDDDLAEWIEALSRSPHAERALLLFNNCYRSQAAQNAERIKELLLRLAPDLELVAPFATAETEPRQQLLF
jgi:uncharacterized protein YecE (DUF72 family)